MDFNIIIIVIVILFFSSLVRSTLGFGDALIAMPLVAMVVGIKTATPIVAIIAIIIGVYIAITNKEQLNLRVTYKLILFTIIGIPVGLFWLTGINESIVKIVLAIILIFFSLFKIFKPHLIVLNNDKLSPIFGFISGILGGAYNTNGPPIIIYGTLRRWSPTNFRVILQGIFLPTNIFIVIGHGLTGLWTKQVFYLLCYSLPMIAIAIILGSKLNKKIPKERFENIVYFSLIIIGIILIVNSIK